jgi:hypothetical protein
MHCPALHTLLLLLLYAASLQHLDKINIDPKELPKDLHDKLGG